MHQQDVVHIPLDRGTKLVKGNHLHNHENSNQEQRQHTQHTTASAAPPTPVAL
jgi:hypothetical protein